MNLLFVFLFASLIGMAAKLKQKNDSLKDLAVKNNVSFLTISQFLIDNKKAIIWNVVAVIAFELFAGHALRSIIANSSDVPEPFFGGWVPIARRDVVTGVVVIIYMTISYMGQDYLFAGLSRTSKDVRSAIEYKARLSDTSTGTLDKPTPLK